MGDRNNKSYNIALTVIITAVLCFMTASAYYNGRLLIKPGSTKLSTVIGILDDKYYEEYNKDAAMEAATKAYVKSLGDPYTEYMTGNELAEFNEMINGEYCGIGVTVQNNAEDNTILVIDVFEGSPAKEAGIEAGDILTKVEGIEYKGEQLQEATNNIQGEEGTEVTVTVLKKSTGKEVDLKIVRKQIEVDTVYSEVIEDNIGYISLSQFGTKTGDEFKTHLDGLMDKNIKSLIIDVRDNGGGTTVAVEAVANCLLPKDCIIYYTADKNGRKNYVKSKGEGIDIPVIVLSNKNSASASEILLASVRDNNVGKIVGEKSYGKGVVQQLIEMSDSTAIKVTIEKYFTPSGEYIQGKGITPDYEVVLDENATTDTQLQKAVELLK